MEHNNENESLPEVIESNFVMLEVIDKHTGRVYRREIPLCYKENDNGILLSGENAQGHTSDIVFWSDVALKKMKDLMGQGPDHSHCD